MLKAVEMLPAVTASPKPFVKWVGGKLSFYLNWLSAYPPTLGVIMSHSFVVA